MTPWGEANKKETRPSFGDRGVPVEQTNDPVYNGCHPPGLPRAYLHPFPIQIVNVPGREVIILYEYDHLVRHVYTDGRPHNTATGPTWMGSSIGKWEGDTFVVDTIGFNDKTWLDRLGHPHSEELHLVERFRRVDANTLQIDLTIDDPKGCTRGPGPCSCATRCVRPSGGFWNWCARTTPPSPTSRRSRPHQRSDPGAVPRHLCPATLEALMFDRMSTACGPLILSAIVVSSAGTWAQTSPAPNSQPNPYPNVAPWGQLPAGTGVGKHERD